jgi:DNA-binding MarR family transcriptional regulator
VADFYPADDDQARIRWIIIDALRRYGTDSGRIGHAFAELHRLQAADLRALVAIMSAEGNGAPLTAGQLREQLGLSAGGASLVIDRLERVGHIRRARDHPTDNRVVHLRYTDQGRATGLAFFGSLGDRAHAILDGFTDDELQVIARFITAMADSTHQHVQELEGRLPGVRTAVPEKAAARSAVGKGGGPDDPGDAVGDRAGAHGLRAGPGRGQAGINGVDDDGVPSSSAARVAVRARTAALLTP